MRRLVFAGLALGILMAFGTLVTPQAVAQTDAAFSEEDKQRITEYLSRRILYGKEEPKESTEPRGKGKKSTGKNKRVPKGLAKRDRLPPGLEKQIVRNGTLPPGLTSRPLPDELERFLGTRRADQSGSSLGKMWCLLKNAHSEFWTL